MKRSFDIAVASIGLVLCSPVLVIVALLIKIESKGPVFFAQERVGRHFQPFQIYKFRTLSHDPSREARPLNSSTAAEVTSLGRVVRRLKIDELPQLLNVIKGDMSLVGPRPELARYVVQFPADYREILSVRPGITDPASIEYVNESAVLENALDPDATYANSVLPEKIAMAKEYVRSAGFWFDMKVIVLTVYRLFRNWISN